MKHLLTICLKYFGLAMIPLNSIVKDRTSALNIDLKCSFTMTRNKGFNYREAAALVRPTLLAQLPRRLPQVGDQLNLFNDDDQRQSEALTRAKRLRADRRRRAR